MTKENIDYSTIQPIHFFSNPTEKTKFNWFAFELACEIERAVPAKLKKHILKRKYTSQTFNQSCIKLAVLLQSLILKKLRNEIPEMKITYSEVEKAFPKLNDQTIDQLLTCTAEAWGNLLDVCVSCPSACISNKDEYCEMFGEKLHN